MATSSRLRWQFSEEEIRSKLEELGYNDIPDKALKEFSNDLHRLILKESGKENVPSGDLSFLATSTFNSPASTATSELTTSHKNEFRHKQAIPDDNSSNYDEDIHYYQDPSTYQKQEVAKQHYQPFVRSSNSHYIAAEKENKTDNGQDTCMTVRLAPKRKVLRRKDGRARVFDESFSNNVCVTDISDIEQRIQNLPLKDESPHTASISDDQSDGLSEWPQWGRSRNALPSCGKMQKRELMYHYRESVANRLQREQLAYLFENHLQRINHEENISFIRPRTGDPSRRGIPKTDPVNRYHQFNKEWRSNKVPGEKTHKNLRWSTREQMLQYEVFEKPRHTYIPNNYVAPTAKKRQALRWEVRSTLANS